MTVKLISLPERYAELARRGRENPPRYPARRFELENGKVIRDRNGAPVGAKSSWTTYILGYPLPDRQVTAKLRQLQEQLQGLPFHSVSPDDLHLTLLNFPTGTAVQHLTATPYNPRFLKLVRDRLQTLPPLAIELREALLTPNGNVIIAGYPAGPELESIRNEFHSPLDIYHLTLTYLLADLSLSDHSLVLDVIDRFNSDNPNGLGRVTFDCLNVLQEFRDCFTGIKFMARIGLGKKAEDHLHPHVPPAIHPVMEQTGISDPRNFYQAVSALIGESEGNDWLRIFRTRDILLRQIETGNAEFIEKVKEKAGYYAEAFTATGAHRYMPAALEIANIFQGKPLYDTAGIDRLIAADPDFEYLKTVCPHFANAEMIPEEYLPPHDPGPIIPFPAPPENGHYIWLDIGSAPKTGGAPTLNILRKGFSTLIPGVNIDIYGTDRSFPYYQMTSQGPELSVYIDPETDGFRDQVVDAANGITYLNASLSQFDITKGMSAFPDGSVHFLSVCKVLHHLARGKWERIPFSSLRFYDPDGNTLREEEMLVRNTRQHQRVVDNMLKILAPGGLLLIDPHAYPYGNDIAWDYINENNDDILFIIQRRGENEFVLYDRHPILYRPNADAFSPQSEQRLIGGYPQHDFSFYRHNGIMALYPGQSEEFYARIEDLFARSNKLVYVHQGWKKAAWGNAAAVAACLRLQEKNQGKKSLVEVFQTYLRYVPDADPIKRRILAEAGQIA